MSEPKSFAEMEQEVRKARKHRRRMRKLQKLMRRDVRVFNEIVAGKKKEA